MPRRPRQMGPTIRPTSISIACLRCGEHCGTLQPFKAEPPMFWVRDTPCARCDGTVAALYAGYDPSPELLIALRTEALISDHSSRAKSRPPTD